MSQAIELSNFERLVKEASQASSVAARLVKERDQEFNRIKNALIERKETTGDVFLDAAVHTFGTGFREQYPKLVKLKELLTQKAGQYILIQELHDEHMTIPAPLHSFDDISVVHAGYSLHQAIGVLAQEPLAVGIGELGFMPSFTSYFLKINFKDNQYVTITPPRAEIVMRLAFMKQKKPKIEVELVTGSEDYESGWAGFGQEAQAPYKLVHPEVFSNTALDSNPLIECKNQPEKGEEARTILTLCIGNDVAFPRLKIDKLLPLQDLYEIISKRTEEYKKPVEQTAQKT